MFKIITMKNVQKYANLKKYRGVIVHDTEE